MVLIILGTALLSSVVTTALPYVPKWYNAFKTRIKRKKNTRPTTNANVEYLLCKVEELEEQINNIAEAKYVRERNRKNNIRREVRDYLSELRND